MKVGFFGGTFDPIHFGHINMAIEMLESHSLDEVWFCPAQVNPHKMNGHPIPVPVAHRLEMVRLAVEEIPQMRVIDIEAQKEGPSFTYDTLEKLTESYPNKHFYLILGDDAIQGFFKWHKPEELVKLVPLLIGSRSPENIDLSLGMGHSLIVEAIKKGLTKTRMMDISATEVRKRLSKRQYVGHLIPAKVVDYIYENRLY